MAVAPDPQTGQTVIQTVSEVFTCLDDARLSPPPALAFSLSPHRHPFYIFPLALALSAIINTSTLDCRVQGARLATEQQLVRQACHHHQCSRPWSRGTLPHCVVQQISQAKYDLRVILAHKLSRVGTGSSSTFLWRLRASARSKGKHTNVITALCTTFTLRALEQPIYPVDGGNSFPIQVLSETGEEKTRFA